MLYIPKIDDYSESLTDEEVKDFVAINFSDYFNSIREKENLRFLFLTTPDEAEKYMQSNSYDNCIHYYKVEIWNPFDPELQLINTKPMIKKKLKELSGELKNFKVQTIFVLDYKKKNDLKIFHSSTKLSASDSDIDEAFNSMQQSIMTKVTKYACEDWIVLDIIIKHSIKIFECYYKEKE